MRIALAVHGWYHPLSETDTYIVSLFKALESVGMNPNIIEGYKLPYGTMTQLFFPPLCRYFLRYRCDDYDIIHDTRGDSVFREVNVATITDFYWNQRKDNFQDKVVQIPMRFYQDYKRTIKKSKRVILLNSTFKTEIGKYFGAEFDQKIKIIPVPISTLPFTASINRMYDVIWIGTTDRRKQLPLFLNSIDKLPRKYKIGLKINYINRHVSDTHPQMSWKINQLRASGYSIDLIDFVKSWSLMEDFYKSSKCLVSTSAYEGFHMPVAEAYLRGVNVVLPRTKLYQSIYGEEVGVHYYKKYSELPQKISEAVESEKFTPSPKIVKYLSYENVGEMLKATYEEAMNY